MLRVRNGSLGFRNREFGSRVSVFGFRVQDLGFKFVVLGLGVDVQSSGLVHLFRVRGLFIEFRVSRRISGFVFACRSFIKAFRSSRL